MYNLFLFCLSSLLTGNSEVKSMIMDESTTFGLIFQMNIPTNRPSAIPWTPIVPARPVFPWTPIVPADPAIPWTPIVPADPAIPWTPIVPARPVFPLTPIVPADPAIPWTPIVPYDKFKNEINSESVDAADTAVDFYCC